MFSSKKNVLETVALLKAHNIRDIVLSPGSRNSPFTLSVAAEPFFNCHTMVDERSAGYFALGIIMATGCPVALCCTSGTAVLNYGPAVAEAFYQHLPLIVISADRPSAWIGQMDGQTIAQHAVFGSMVLKSIQVPEIVTDEDKWHANRVLNEALNACLEKGCGPVHINLPITEPLGDFSVETLPEVRVIRSTVAKSTIEKELEALAPSHLKELAETLLKSPKVMLVVGQRLPAEDGLLDTLESLSANFGVLVLAEPLSNLQSQHFFQSMEALLSVKTVETPTFLITLGGHVVSKALKNFLRTHKPARHLHLTASDDTPDLYQSLTDVVRGEPVLILKQLLHVLLEGSNVIKQVNNALRIKSFKGLEQLPFSDLKATGYFIQALPEKAVLFIGNSSTVRNVQLFPLPAGCRVYCNRGTNGIEGTLSTACGFASVTTELVFVELGDLCFFYDLNILSNPSFPNNLRILLPNNGGGGIFHTINTTEVTHNYQKFVAASHPNEAKLWVKAANLAYLRVGSVALESDTSGRNWEEDALHEAIDQLIHANFTKSVVLEVLTPSDNGKEALAAYFKESLMQQII